MKERKVHRRVGKEEAKLRGLNTLKQKDLKLVLKNKDR